MGTSKDLASNLIRQAQAQLLHLDPPLAECYFNDVFDGGSGKIPTKRMSERSGKHETASIHGRLEDFGEAMWVPALVEG